jgi:hypothetical protein
MLHSPFRSNKSSNLVTALIVLSLAVMLVVACRSGSANKNAAAAAPKSSAGQITVTGVLNSKFMPEEIAPVKVVDSIGINFVEKFPCGVSIQFPINLEKGSHEIGDHLHSPIPKVFGEYSPDCGKSGMYLSTKGTLNLTSAGDKYSGTFQFEAGLSTNDSKKVNVSGSFNDVALR